MTAYVFGAELRHQITDNLSRLAVRRTHGDGLRAAAVAIVVTKCAKSGEAAVFLTLRPATIKRHSSQYALPGGRLDGGETVTEGALRELREELALVPEDAEPLGRLDDYPTRSGFRISPVVFWGGAEPHVSPCPDEVAEVFRIPFSELDLDSFPRLTESSYSEHPVLSVLLPTLGHYMFAPTAAILYQFREVAMRGGTTRVAHYSQPEFAWS